MDILTCSLPPENKRETHANLNIELIVKNNTIINK
jgi:hypothetical protein